jgi:hypothetical protein
MAAARSPRSLSPEERGQACRSSWLDAQADAVGDEFGHVA